MEASVRKQTTVLIFLALLFGLTILGLLWVAGRMYDRQASVIEAKERLASYEQNKRAYAVESVQLREIGVRIAQLEQDTVTLATVPQFLSNLESVAAAFPIDFTITAVDTPASDGADPQFFIDMSAEGSVDAIMSFADELLHQRYQVVFEQFSLFAEKQPAEQVGKQAPTWQLLARVSVISF